MKNMTYRSEYCRPPIERILNSSWFCVSVPVLSENMYPIWPRSSLMVNVRQLIGCSCFKRLSRDIVCTCKTRTRSKETYSAMGTITWNKITNRNADRKKWAAPSVAAFSTRKGTYIQSSPKELSHRSDSPAQIRQIVVRIKLENNTSRLMHRSICACLLDARCEDLMIFVWLPTHTYTQSCIDHPHQSSTYQHRSPVHRRNRWFSIHILATEHCCCHTSARSSCSTSEFDHESDRYHRWADHIAARSWSDRECDRWENTMECSSASDWSRHRWLQCRDSKCSLSIERRGEGCRRALSDRLGRERCYRRADLPTCNRRNSSML